MSGGKVAFDTVSQVDLESLDHVPDAGLEAWFRAIGEVATASQLGMFLDGGPGDEDDKAALVDRFARRRAETVRRLRSSREDLRRILSGGSGS